LPISTEVDKCIAGSAEENVFSKIEKCIVQKILLDPSDVCIY